MPEHLSAEQISSYRERRSPPEELLRVDDHISQCSECRERLSHVSEMGAALHAAGPNIQQGEPRELRQALLDAGSQRKHLSYEQLEEYVDGKMPDGDRKNAQAHLQVCPMCSEELQDLNSLRAELLGRHREVREAWWARFVVRWLTVRQLALALGTAAALVLAVVTVTRRLSPTKEVPSPETLNTRPAAITPGQEVKSWNGPNPFLAGIEELSPEERSAVADAVLHEMIRTPDTLERFKLGGRQETLLGETKVALQFEVLGPVGEVVLEVRPVFHWQRLQNAKSYSVTVFDRNMNPVLASPPLHATKWTADRPLKRGQLYLWQATAQLGNGKSVSAPSPPSPEARFLVLDQSKADEITRFAQAHPESHVAIGILVAQAGLLKMGEAELNLIPTSDPNYTLAQKLLKSIERIRQP
jgi:hypothetical protein